MNRSSYFHRPAFSLIEVALALGIISVVFVALLGLLPIGLRTMDSAIDATVETQIVQQITNMARQTSFASLEQNQIKSAALGGASNAGNEFYFDDLGQLITDPARAPVDHIYKAVANCGLNPTVPANAGVYPNPHMVLVTVQVTRRTAPQTVRTRTFYIADNGLGQ